MKPTRLVMPRPAGAREVRRLRCLVRRCRGVAPKTSCTSSLSRSFPPCLADLAGISSMADAIQAAGAMQRSPLPPGTPSSKPVLSITTAFSLIRRKPAGLAALPDAGQHFVQPVSRVGDRPAQRIEVGIEG